MKCKNCKCTDDKVGACKTESSRSVCVTLKDIDKQQVDLKPSGFYLIDEDGEPHGNENEQGEIVPFKINEQL